MRSYTRSDLIVAGTLQPYECVLCGNHGLEKNEITHQPDCVFANNCITGIRIDGISGGIVLHQDGGRWWWTSPASGNVYHIEKWAECYELIDSNRIGIKQNTKLYNLRLWIGLNQGTL